MKLLLIFAIVEHKSTEIITPLRMKNKRLLQILLMAFLCMGTASASTFPFETTELIDNDDQSITINVVSGSVLRINGGAGEILKVYNLAGICVKSVRIDGQDKRYDLNLTKGCYIIKVGKVVRKISIR